MSVNSETNQDRDREIQREILVGREFSLAEVIGREGGDFLKGDSPIPKLVQVVTEINLFINQNLADNSGALQAVLHNWVKEDQARVSKYLDSPLFALVEIIENLINNEELFYEFVKQVDSKWGQMYQEKPYFQRPGQAPHPDDEYTHESVFRQLQELLEKAQNH
jgi:deoxyribodipyrimidine photolyase